MIYGVSNSVSPKQNTFSGQRTAEHPAQTGRAESVETLRLLRNVLLRSFVAGAVFALVMLIAMFLAWP
jgi:hypothetical protein